MDFDFWHLRQPNHFIVGDTLLNDAPLIDRYLTVERRRHSIDDAALYLRFDAIWIDHRAAIDRGNNPLNAKPVFFD